MDQIRLCLKLFKESTLDNKNEHICFDIITGDFNFDNISPLDRMSSNHDIFKDYIDPLSIRPGIDHPLAIGTEMRYHGVQHELTQTALTFKEALQCSRYLFEFKIYLNNIIIICSIVFSSQRRFLISG